MRPFIGIFLIFSALVSVAGDLETLLRKDRAVLEARTDHILAKAKQALAELSDLQLQTGNAPAKIELKKNSAIVQCTEVYLAILEETSQRLTLKGAKEEAQDVQAEIKRVRSAPFYVTACQSLQSKGITGSATDASTLQAKTLTGPAWDPTQEFSAKDNPSGVWTYGWTPALGGSITPFRAHRAEPNLDGWMKGEPDYPSVWVNHSNRVYDGVRPGELSLHPNLSSECAVLRWMAPTASQISLKGRFGAGDAGAMNVYVLHNDKSCFQVLETRRDEPFDLALHVETGDRVDFVVGPGSAGHGWGNIPIAVTIAAN